MEKGQNPKGENSISARDVSCDIPFNDKRLSLNPSQWRKYIKTTAGLFSDIIAGLQNQTCFDFRK